jgi:small-conductance mechanosensitive channel
MVSKSKPDIFRIVLRIIVTVAAVLYILIFIEEAFPPYPEDMRESNLGIAMVFVLFLWFAIGYVYLWLNQKISGILLILWYLLLVLTASFIWKYGGMTIIIGWPIPVLGILLLFHYHLKKRITS